MLPESTIILTLNSLQSVLQLAAGMNGAILAFRDVIHLPIRIESERIETILRLYELRSADEQYSEHQARLAELTKVCVSEMQGLRRLESARHVRWIVLLSLAFMCVEILLLIAGSIHQMALDKSCAWAGSLVAFAPVACVLWEGWRCHRQVAPLREARIRAGAH